MSGTTSKYYFPVAGFMVFIMTCLPVFAQDHQSYRSLKLTVGGGYGYYFNTFSNVSDENVKNWNPAFYGKFMWEPEHRLRIGFESGYYRIYSTSRLEVGSVSRKLTTNMSAIPLFLSFGMKLTRHLDLNFATGGAIITYNVITNNSKSNPVKGETLSLSDFAAGFTWSWPLGERMELGTELKYLFLGKTADNHISVLLNLSYRISHRKIVQPD